MALWLEEATDIAEPIFHGVVPLELAAVAFGRRSAQRQHVRAAANTCSPPG
jgi:hypothetical protein